MKSYKDSNIWKSIPKVELHCHLEGSIKLPTIKEQYKRLNLELPFENDDQLFDYFFINKPMESLAAFLDKFQRSQVIFKDTLAIQEVTKSLVFDKYKDGVKLLEIRYSPCHIQAYCHESLDVIHQAVCKGMAQGIEMCDNDIEVGLICIAQAGTSKEVFMEAFEFCLRNKDSLIGFDNAGPEVNLREFQQQFDKIYQAGVNITIHAAEDLITGAPHNALDAIQKLHATRIGHGIQIHNHPEIVEEIAKKDILLEISPTSNIFTGSVESMKQHPIFELYKMGIKVCINTDDPGCFNCDLSGEYKALNENLDFTLEDFEKMNQWALQHSFLDTSSKDRVRKKYFPNTEIKTFN